MLTNIKKSGISLPEIVFIQGGSFMQGSNIYTSEFPIHKTTVSDFYIGKFPITNIEYSQFLNSYGSNKIVSGNFAGRVMFQVNTKNRNWGLYFSDNHWLSVPGYEYFPVIYVNWFGAVEYCKYLSEISGKTVRLPTESEWEYVAGGGQEVLISKNDSGIINLQKWAGTNEENELAKYAWFEKKSGNQTNRVGQKLPNLLGIYDMSGNVWEMCSDEWEESYSDINVQKPVNKDLVFFHTIRGGSWLNNSDYCRVAYRSPEYMDACRNNLGFRVLVEL